MLQADVLMKSQDLQGLLLGELIFSDRGTSAALINRLKQTIRQNQYEISDKQINDIYERQAPPDIYWYCLRREARSAGIAVTNTEAAELLGKVVPQLFQGATYSQVISAIMSRQRIPEEEILATLGKLLAVLQYAHMICSSEDVTTRQLMHAAGIEEEGTNVEYLRFDSAVFTETQDQPDEKRLIEHFEKYKEFFANEVSDENPYGFGYRLPDRVRLEYIAVKLDDVRTIVAEPRFHPIRTIRTRS
jgi:hypothetical protein